MKPVPLTPIEQAAEDTAPNRVNWDIKIVWLDGQMQALIGYGQSYAEAADVFETLAEELRDAAKVLEVQP